MQIVMVKLAHFPNAVDLVRAPDGVSADKVAWAVASNSLRAKVSGRVPGHSYKVAESDNFVEAMIESAKL